VTAHAAAGFRRFPLPLRLLPAVQHYEWGGFDFIPRLIGADNAERRPFAELWIGAHPRGPCRIELGGEDGTLADLIAAAPRETLGGETADAHGGELPFLLKVLDARRPLSIQAHPSREQAREGFARENAAGVSLEAPGRNYRDANHKPEIHVALTEFRMLHGFRPLEEIARVMGEVPEIGAVMPDFDRRLDSTGWDPQAQRGVLRDLYARIMTLPQERVDGLLGPLVARLERECPIDRDGPDFWALSASRTFPLPGGSRDRGIFSMYLLNLVRLRPGQGTFQPAGTLHAYLEGVNVELMASSDNVLRGGLTPKHVDAQELLRTLSFETGRPTVIEGTPLSATETIFAAPVDDFVLSRIVVGSGRVHEAGTGHGPECLLVMEGQAVARAAGRTLALPRGAALFTPAGIGYTLEAAGGAAVALTWKAGIPLRRGR
jgi:mannose-6-phosphate isomerase class I